MLRFTVYFQKHLEIFNVHSSIGRCIDVDKDVLKVL